MYKIDFLAWRNLTRLGCLFIILLVYACKEKNAADNGDYSPEFLKIKNKVENIWKTGDIKGGLVYLDSAFLRIPSPTSNDRFRRYAFHYVYYAKTIHKQDSALIYSDSLVAEAAKMPNSRQYSMNVAEASFSRGDALFELQQFSDAYQSYYQGYLMGKNYVNMAALSDYTYRMGMIMYKQRKYNLAVKYFKDSYAQNVRDKQEVNRGFVGFYRRQELLDNIGLSFRHNNQDDSALVYFNKALVEITTNTPLYPERKQHMDMARGVVYGNMAEVYIQNGENAKAEELLKKSIAINLRGDYDNRDAQLTEVKLGQLYLKQRKDEELVKLLADLKAQLDTIKNPDAEADYNRLMSGYYANKSNLRLALSHLQLYNLQKDSITKANNLILETNVGQQLSNYEKQHEIDTLSTHNKLQLIYIYAVTIVAVLTAIIMFLVYRNWKRSKKDVLTVNLLNQQINEQNHVLENALNELNNSSKEKDRILRTVAHDLRNPIGGIASLTAMMAEDEYTDDQKELINLVKETSVNSLELINEILEATNLSSVPLNLERVDINSLVNNSVELLRFKAAEKNQQILLEPLDKPMDLLISREKIWRVISNLISNAIKFSPTGETISVKLTEDGHQVVISVRDNGIGIPETLKDQVFNMFTSAQRTGTEGEKSFGLGLSICRQIMEKHKGKIWFQSNEQQGTTFFISLPYFKSRDFK
ncbi:GHKL domain-containing protein [Mucilaginibacter terrenus]|uniref:histidine kinase n=1 Tax=Mucilaginibacter terrenus TaxID=2482727 RepID=A0A3E2NUZ7_9SPHI|nr:tetratricopeptide repeat-containing sensor histidine kinase [Mucilaginibacter terrenus]RFZ84843.1 GHKL domain-containing protein [Mucilaginibacter terrenus]